MTPSTRWLDTQMVITILLLAIPLVYFYWRASRSNSRLPLPPGPALLPLIGNVLDIPQVSPWLGYRDLCIKYGNIVSLRALGQTLIILGDTSVAVDLLEKRSAVYSSRLRSHMPDLTGWGWNLGMMPYGQQWRKHRRVFWQHFQPGSISKYYQSQTQGAYCLLARLLDSPDHLHEHIRYSLGSSIIRATYGLEVAPNNDTYITAFEEGITSIDLLVKPGALIIDFFPLLKYILPWFPGATLQRRCAYYRKAVPMLRDLPWNDAKAAINAGKNSLSMVNTTMERLSHMEGANVALEEEVAKNAMGVAYGAGLDTQQTTLIGFFLAMTLYPDVQRKAQEELDAVIGPLRLPSVDDRDALPYVNAVVKETMRWHNATPLGIPHSSSTDDEYNGYFIPKDSIIIVNTWSILHDPVTYPQPEDFIPERYFLPDGKPNPDVIDPSTVLFGFGRRICPGRHFADAGMFVYIASILHTLRITPALDENGQPLQIQPRPSSTVISHLQDVECVIKPRSAASATLIRSSSLESQSLGFS